MANPSSLHQHPIDALAPADVARRLQEASVKRADLPIGSLVVLALLGGVYIGLGGALATLALTDSSLGFGPGKLVAGVAFSLGLIILVIAGGELFTGNNLMTLALASGKVSPRAVLRNWTVSYFSNAAGAMLLAIAIQQSGILESGNVKATAVRIAETKAQLGFGQAFLRGILCNMLVCLAVWLSVAARSVEGKIVAIIFPIGAFVALGFEHCVANLYLLPVGMLSGATVSLGEMVGNIVPVTLGNTVGGVGLAVAYWLVYLTEGTAHHAPLASLPEQTPGVGFECGYVRSFERSC
jgi:formate transporter